MLYVIVMFIVVGIFDTAPSLADTTQSSYLAQKAAGDNAIFASEAAAAVSTTFMRKQTQIVIEKSTERHSLGSGRRENQPYPRIIVKDAATRGLVCLPLHALGDFNSRLSAFTSGADISGDVGDATEVEQEEQGGLLDSSLHDDNTAATPSPADATLSLSDSAGSTGGTGNGGSAVAATGESAAAEALDGAGGASVVASGKHVKAVIGQGEGITACVSQNNMDEERNSYIVSKEERLSGSLTHQESGATQLEGQSATISQTHIYNEQHSEIASAIEDLEGTGVDDSVHQFELVANISRDFESDYLEKLSALSECECVPSYLCDDSGYILTYGEGLIDIRFNADEDQPAITDRCGPGQKCCRHRPDKRAAIGWYPDTCGVISPARLDSRVVGGNVARLGEAPWQVAVLTELGDSRNYTCGGSLIEEDVVLTAAHCVQRAREASGRLIIRAGVWDTNFPDEVYPSEDIAVRQVISHERFHKQTLFNDVALLLLERRVQLAQHVNIICLPDEELINWINFTDCIASGWGKESFGASHYSNIMKKVPLHVVEKRDCQDRLRTTRLGRWFRLHSSFTCAVGDTGYDTCTGDGGSPLVCSLNNSDGLTTYVQVGVVAWGIGCGQPGLPGVYSDVIELRHWITARLAEGAQERRSSY